MNRKVLLFLFGLSLVIVACGFASKNKQSDEPNNNDNGKQLHLINGRTDPQQPQPSNPAIDNPSDPIVDNPSVPNEKPITQWDSKTLDDKVIEQAKLFGKDPKTYRMLLRTNPDGTKIYRMLGMHIIVNPNGEEAYLPDEI